MRAKTPLLRDWHTHPMLYAALRAGVDLNRAEIDGATDAIRRIRERIMPTGNGWTIGYGWNSGRYALNQEAFDDLPPVVVLNLSLHGLIVNRAGRRLLAETDPAIAEQIDDVAWLERNLRRVLNVFAISGATADRLREFFDWLLEEHGIYAVDEMLLVDESEIRLVDEAGLSDRVRFWAAPETFESLPAGLRQRVHGVKLFADGAIGAWTAALHAPYRGAEERGLLLYTDPALEDLIRRYAGEGTPMAIHAIGDRAIDQVVDAAARAECPRPSAIRLEHVQFISESTARRARSLGLSLCMQPNFSDDSRHYADRLPAGYAEANNPFRLLIDRIGFRAGHDLWWGSDGMPHGVREALRQSLFPPIETQVLTLDEFVAGYGMDVPEVGSIAVAVDTAAKSVECEIHLNEPRGNRPN